MKKVYVVMCKLSDYTNNVEVIECEGVYKSLKKAKKAINKIANDIGVYFQETPKNKTDLLWGICYTYRFLTPNRDEFVYKVIECVVDKNRTRNVFDRYLCF